MTNTIDRLKELDKAATDGPWERNSTGGYIAFFHIEDEKTTDYISAPKSKGMEPTDSNAELIAIMRNSLPKFLELTEAASDESITWNEDRCDPQQYQQREQALLRLVKALAALRGKDD